MSIALRARDSWEAVDLGAVMLRAWWRPVYVAWFALVVPLSLLFHLLLTERPWAALLLTWWLKPLYDRVVLHVLAQAVFGSTPSTGQTLADLGTPLRDTSLLASLTWKRLEVGRALYLPVRQLEHQRGIQARERERLLGRRVSGQAAGLFYACLAFQLIVLLSLSAGLDLLVPAGIETDHGLQAFLAYLFGAEAPTWAIYLNDAFVIVAMSAIEPLYVASGFALYLNRRTGLEAWDLELSFRRLANSAAARAARGAAIVLCLVTVAGLQPQSADAASPSSQQIIREVLAAPEFQEYRSGKTWQRRDQADPERRSSLGAWARLLEAFSLSLAQLARVAAYGLLALGAFFLGRWLWRQLGAWEKATPAGRESHAPEVVFGLDVRPESLPEDLAHIAAATARTDPRLALSLLYRGALATLIHRDRLRVEDGDTEADCLHRVEASSAHALAAYFSRLVATWSRTAYGQQLPDAAAMQLLCVEWPEHFAATRAAR